MIKAITFDCWDNLLDDDESRDKKRKEHLFLIFKDHGFPVTQDEMNELFSEEAKLFQNHIIEHNKTQNSRARVGIVLELAGVQIPVSEINKIADYCDLVALGFRPPIVPGIKEALEVLSEVYKLGVICNTGWHSACNVSLRWVMILSTAE
ncbi:MAG: hypothetical protein GTN73_07845 [Candidatus Aminicenantes bacterium]|nr:hypothetical protein [Candidatus Aminicenantes bacterium]